MGAAPRDGGSASPPDAGRGSLFIRGIQQLSCKPYLAAAKLPATGQGSGKAVCAPRVQREISFRVRPNLDSR